MIKYIIGAVLLAAVVGVGANYIIMSEQAKCDARIKAAIAKFEQLQVDVKQVVDDFEKSVDIDKGDKADAEVLREILVRLSKAAGGKCTLDGADVADVGRLRNGR